jgi:hypothetical protein
MVWFSQKPKEGPFSANLADVGMPVRGSGGFFASPVRAITVSGEIRKENSHGQAS